jgi:hypothetical protein
MEKPIISIGYKLSCRKKMLSIKSFAKNPAKNNANNLLVCDFIYVD